MSSVDAFWKDDKGWVVKGEPSYADIQRAKAEAMTQEFAKAEHRVGFVLRHFEAARNYYKSLDYLMYALFNDRNTETNHRAARKIWQRGEWLPTNEKRLSRRQREHWFRETMPRI